MSKDDKNNKNDSLVSTWLNNKVDVQGITLTFDKKLSMLNKNNDVQEQLKPEPVKPPRKQLIKQEQIKQIVKKELELIKQQKNLMKNISDFRFVTIDSNGNSGSISMTDLFANDQFKSLVKSLIK